MLSQSKAWGIYSSHLNRMMACSIMTSLFQKVPEDSILSLLRKPRRKIQIRCSESFRAKTNLKPCVRRESPQYLWRWDRLMVTCCHTTSKRKHPVWKNWVQEEISMTPHQHIESVRDHGLKIWQQILSISRNHHRELWARKCSSMEQTWAKPRKRLLYMPTNHLAKFFKRPTRMLWRFKSRFIQIVPERSSLE